MDVVNNPSHYKIDNVLNEAGTYFFDTDVLSIMDALSRKITKESYLQLSGMEQHYLFSAIAYIFRSPFKFNMVEDLSKAVFYLNKIIENDSDS